MADHKFNVTIVTPDGTIYDKDTTMIILKTQNGEMGILPNHIPVVASLQIDAVRVQLEDGEDKIAVNGGFVEFSDNAASIVADSAEIPEKKLMLPVHRALRHVLNNIFNMPMKCMIKMSWLVLKWL